MLHKTKEIVVQKADIDEGIIPLINWMNSLQDVYTLYSCQGSNKKIADCALCTKNTPYVSFLCFNPVNLAKILQLFEDKAQTEIYYDNGVVKYSARFYNVQYLQLCVDFIYNPKYKTYNDYNIF